MLPYNFYWQRKIEFNARSRKRIRPHIEAVRTCVYGAKVNGENSENKENFGNFLRYTQIKTILLIDLLEVKREFCCGLLFSKSP